MNPHRDDEQQSLIGKLAQQRTEMQHSAQALNAPLERVDTARHAALFAKDHWPVLAGLAVGAWLIHRLRPGTLSALFRFWMLSNSFRK